MTSQSAIGALPTWPSQALIREVGLRDGLQSLDQTLPTAAKQAWIEAQYRAGFREIEVGSFVPARYLPQLADTAALVAFARQLPKLIVSVLVPNLKGAQAALESQAHRLLVPLSASEAHSVANLRKTRREVIAEVGQIRAERDQGTYNTQIEGGVGTAFGCPLQGEVPPAEVLDLIKALLDAGADTVSLADTVGYANPRQVAELFAAALEIAGPRLSHAHFHDTRGLALANCCAAMMAGVNRFDASLGGIGGCPHAPGASGNVATEDLAFMLDQMGVATGVDLPALLDLRAELRRWLGESVPLHGALAQAGLPITGLRGAIPTQQGLNA